jgi:hypothetical protein
MHQGEIANFTCPGDLDKGGARNQYIQGDTEIIPAFSDTKYQIEITECAMQPDSFKEDHGFGALDGVVLEHGRNFYIQSQMKDHHGDIMVIEIDPKDKYSPRKTGVHNVMLQERSIGKKEQMWFYDKTDKTIHSYYNKKEDTILLMGSNNNMATYKNKKLAS